MGNHLFALYPSDVHALTHALADPDDADGPNVVTMELRASSADEARIRVQHLLGQVRAKAGLPVIESELLWVAPLAPGPESSVRFLEQAEELLRSERYELAVVAVHIHLELHVSTLLRMLVGSDESKVAEGLLNSRVEWTHAQAWQRDLFEHLIGRSVSKDFPGWKRYATHVERRNAIVHRGQAVDLQAARESLDVVTELWRWLNDAALEAMRK